MAVRRDAMRARRRRSAPLGVLLALLCVSLPSGAAAQLDTITIDTSEGLITIELFDFPDVVAHAQHFRQTQSKLGNAVFHRADKQRFCDDTYCFECQCTMGLCESDPNARTCDWEGAKQWIVDDQTQPAPYLQAGRFRLDENYALEELSNFLPDATTNCMRDDLPACLPDVKPTYSNTAYTVAYVRVDDGATKRLTSEWIINLEDNPELDGQPPDYEDAYFVFGAVRGGKSVVAAIAGLKTYDATEDASVPVALRMELEQVPVFDSFTGEPGSTDLFIEPCDPANPDPGYDHDLCLNPACSELTLDGFACADPHCLGLIPLTTDEQEQVDEGISVPRFCTAPALPSFPVVIPEPAGVLGEAAALLVLVALTGLGAHRRRRHVARATPG